MKIQSHPLTGHVLVIGIIFAAFVIFVSHYAAMEKEWGCNCGSSQNKSQVNQDLAALFTSTPSPQVVPSQVTVEQIRRGY